MYVHVYSHYICNVQSLLLLFCCKIYKYSNMNMINTHLEEIMKLSIKSQDIMISINCGKSSVSKVD